MNSVDLIVYPASDVSKTKAFFTTLLGTEPYADTPYYVGFRVGDMEIGVVPKAAQQGASGALAYATSATSRKRWRPSSRAAQKVQDITDVANGLLVASVKDPDGTTVGLRQFPKS